MSFSYRPEIDGLRAIAISSVVLYHAEFAVYGVHPFRGGFIGVDVFFVISGYLITSIILKKIKDGSFSFANFYERRARRILPALLTVMFASIPFALIYMLPKAVENYAGSGLSALAFVSNIWFLQEDGYWAEPSGEKPFLHTWTLSVEEQFYILFPIVLFFLWRFARGKITVIFILGFLVSLELANLGSVNYTDATFFLLPTRLWELLAGAILAKLEMGEFDENSSFLDAVMPVLGIFLIAIAVVSFYDEMEHPSFVTLLPVMGTMLIIRFSKKGGLVSSVLGCRPFVAVGLISYSLYLWHFPIFAFAKIRGDTPSLYGQIGYISLTIALSISTYYLVEKPFRNFRLKTSWFLVFCSVCLTVLALFFGFIVKFPCGAHLLTKGFGYHTCVLEEKQKSRKYPHLMDYKSFDKSMLAEYESNKKNVLIIGDSHVSGWSSAFAENYDESSYNFFELNYLGCRFDVQDKIYRATKKHEFQHFEKCEKNRRILNNEEFIKSFDTLILASFRPFSYSANKFRWKIIGKLQKKNPDLRVLILGNYFQLDKDIKCGELMRVTDDARVCIDNATYPEVNHKFSREEFFYEFETIDYEFIDITKLCKTNRSDCPFQHSEVPFLFSDWNHMTWVFTEYVLHNLIKQGIAPGEL